MKPRLLVLHDSIRGELDPEELALYLKRTFDIPTLPAGDFWIAHSEDPIGLSRQLASLRVTNPQERGLNPEPLQPEVDFERRRLSDPQVKAAGILYDATALMGLYWENMTADERAEHTCHIILTRELLGTWDKSDLRWHARPIVLGYPCLVSTTGIVEGPARPARFYQLLQAGVDPGTLKQEMSESIIDYGDPRMTEIMKGYCAQAVFYSVTGEAFCPDKGCRLHNAHWQEEMIYAQIKSPYEFCETHRKALETLRGTSRGREA